ncbi:hypothetical protein [Lacticaseibacillus paracasei]|uniref:hypothetical protein n=1 Tax=Lacticaseibacillus paracasei TaxID=1597 RepID=UPI00058E100D|nr:hypothetical protein [Lacticaseibacillus paracasei]ALX88705.1 hypothetical protein AWC33_05575 [Lacticaseibacillus paracasei]
MKREKLRPLRIFISSAMKNPGNPERRRILELRTSLNERLAKYSFIEPFILEHDSSSILDLKTEYLTQLADSNLVIVLLDSEYPIPTGVQIEITAARNCQIPRLFCILPAKNDKGSEMKQQPLAQGESSWVQELPKSDDYLDEIENILFNQMVTIYKAFFDKNSPVLDNDQSTTTTFDEPLALDSSSLFEKAMFNQIGLSKEMIRTLVFHDSREKKRDAPASAIDESVSNLILRIFFNKRLPFDWDKLMLSGIQSANSKVILTEALKKVLTARLKAVYLFFSSKPEEALKTLKELLKTVEINEVPTWMFQDTLIDLRNLLNIEGEAKNQWHSENPYQKQLDEFPQPFYYPGIDHSLERVYSWVRKEENKTLTASSTQESSYGPGIALYPDSLTDAFVLAACNGSIAQIRQLPKNLNIISEMLLKKYQNVEYLRDVLQNQLLMGDSHERMALWIKHYNYLVGQFSEEDALSLLQSSQSYPVDTEKLGVEASTLRLVGDYLSDKSFDDTWTVLYAKIKAWATTPVLIVQPTIDILGLFRNSFRIPQNDIIAILEVLTPSSKRYYEELADIIVGAIDYTAVQIDQRHRVIAVLFAIVKNSDQTRFMGKIRLAILSVLSAWPTESTELKRYLIKNYGTFFNRDIFPFIWNNQKEIGCNDFLKEQLSEMKSQNEKQHGKVIVGFANDPFATLNISIKKHAGLNSQITGQVFEQIVDTLNNPHQIISTKQSATELLMTLLSQSNGSHEDFEMIIKKIQTSKITAEPSGFFEISTPTSLIDAIRSFTDIAVSGLDTGKLHLTLTLDTSPRYLRFVSELLVDFIPLALYRSKLSSTLPPILQFLITHNSRESENELLMNIFQSLVCLSSDSQYSEIALGQLQRLVSDTNNVVKRNLVVQIHESSTVAQKALSSIKAQLMSSSNYSVRDLAMRDFS